jgi:hypothetical protein
MDSCYRDGFCRGGSERCITRDCTCHRASRGAGESQRVRMPWSGRQMSDNVVTGSLCGGIEIDYDEE